MGGVDLTIVAIRRHPGCIAAAGIADCTALNTVVADLGDGIAIITILACVGVCHPIAAYRIATVGSTGIGGGVGVGVAIVAFFSMPSVDE
jgi:hypothetical protein